MNLELFLAWLTTPGAGILAFWVMNHWTWAQSLNEEQRKLVSLALSGALALLAWGCWYRHALPARAERLANGDRARRVSAVCRVRREPASDIAHRDGTSQSQDGYVAGYSAMRMTPVRE